MTCLMSQLINTKFDLLENINLSSGAINSKGNDRSNELIKTFEGLSSGIPTEIQVFENTAEIHLSGYLELLINITCQLIRTHLLMALEIVTRE